MAEVKKEISDDSKHSKEKHLKKTKESSSKKEKSSSESSRKSHKKEKRNGSDEMKPKKEIKKSKKYTKTPKDPKKKEIVRSIKKSVINYGDLDNKKIIPKAPQIRHIRSAIGDHNLSEGAAKLIIERQTEDTIEMIKEARRCNRIRCGENGNRRMEPVDFENAKMKL